MSRADAEVVLDTLVSFAARDLTADDPRRDLITAGREVAAMFNELRAAAHASLTARDLSDQMAADEWLARALAACEPTDTDHNREAVDGLCVEESDNGV